MSRFTVRVELHEVNNMEPDGDDYEKLHLAMQRKQYFRVIESGDHKWYHLPHAEYTVAWDVEVESVLEEAKSIVASVWKRFGVLITQSAGRQWVGLKTATDDEVEELRNTGV